MSNLLKSVVLLIAINAIGLRASELNSFTLNISAKEYKPSANNIFRNPKIDLSNIDLKTVFFIPRNYSNTSTTSRNDYDSSNSKLSTASNSTKSSAKKLNSPIENDIYSINNKEIIINDINDTNDNISTINNFDLNDNKINNNINTNDMVTNNKLLLKTALENINNKNFDLAKQNLEQFLNNIQEVKINDIERETVSRWLQNVVVVLPSQYTRNDHKLITQKRDLLKNNILYLSNNTNINNNINLTKLTSFYKQYEKQYAIFKNNQFNKIKQIKNSLIHKLNKSNIHYDFKSNRKRRDNNDNAKHLILDSNHVFNDIGKIKNAKFGVINGIESLPYYNELHDITKALYDKENNKIQTEFEDQVFDIINSTLINPCINQLLQKLNVSNKYFGQFRVDDNKTNPNYLLEMTSTENHNKLALHIINKKNKIEIKFATIFGLDHEDYDFQQEANKRARSIQFKNK